MALKKFARRDVILPAVVFLLTFVVALFSLRLLSLNQEKDERLRAVYAAESTISRVSSQLNRYLAESDFIKKYIESGHVLREEEFAVISSNMQDGSSVIKTHELAKDGVVSQVYPVAGNEAAIGLDMLHNPARKKEANLAKNSGMYTIAGPFELVQGGTGALLFDPIYTYSEKGERSFWGFSILVLQWDDFIEEVELDKMEDAGYRYQIWKKDPYTGEKIVIAESEEDFPGNALEVACSVPNDTWYFEIIPKAGWFSNQQLLLGIVIATIIGMMAAYACWELMNRHQKDLQHEAALEKSAQEARAANEAKTRFLFNMSHDIRTPLNAILGMSELGLREEAAEEKDNCFRDIRGSGRILLENINSILDLSKIEAGKMEITPETYHVLSTLHDTITILRMRAQEKKLTFRAQVDETIPATLYGDDVNISHIIMNLGSNAIKYTREGTITLTVTWEPQGEDGSLVIHMEDTGVGIRQEDLPYIFQSYGRLDRKANRHIEGTGLGLPICQQLTELMHGQLGVESTYGVGSNFWVRLPQKVIDPTPCGPYREGEQRENNQNRNSFTAPEAVVLVVDDQPLNLKVCQGLLAPYEMEVYTARSGQEALRQMTQVWPDLVLMDHMMPEMDGITALAKLRQVSNVPVILLTAKSEDTDKILGLNVGPDDYITKPFNPVEVAARVRSQLRRYFQLGGGALRPEVLTLGTIQMDDREKTVAVDGDPVALTPTEYDILKLLLEHPGQVFSPREIYRKVWKDAPFGSENTVAVHIRHLREKIEIDPAEPRYLKVVWGQGYKLEKGMRT